MLKNLKLLNSCQVLISSYHVRDELNKYQETLTLTFMVPICIVVYVFDHEWQLDGH